MRRAKRSVLGRAASALLIPVCLGSVPDDPATRTVRAALARAKQVADLEAPRSEKLVLLRGLSRELFDTGAMAQRAIGDVLQGRSPEEQEEFRELFSVFIVRAYLQKLLFFRDPRFGFARAEIGDDSTLVRTFVRSGPDEYYVDYEMYRIEGEWRATEIVVEGIGLIDNYGEQFASVIAASSFEELLEMLRRKTKRLIAKDGP